MKGMVEMNEYGGYRYPQKQVHKHEFCAVSISSLPSNPVPAMLYVPMQTDTSCFDDEKAFECGTLFIVLSKPFAGKCCK
jgi:hypothetical protein